ncbi:URM1 [Auxenochlorella protothecoides x Auxenochlorella symbiontica]
MVKVVLEFSGGLDLLFDNQKSISVDVPAEDGKEEVTLSRVIFWARDNVLTSRPELFVQASSVRPGILVLVNDVDWELSGTLDTIVDQGDRITFISTLHGG